jgi:hypothetical protein
MNIEDRKLKIGGVASGFAFGYDPTGRSIFPKIVPEREVYW